MDAAMEFSLKNSEHNKIYIVRNNKILFRLKIKDPDKDKYNSYDGELDIMMDGIKNHPFDNLYFQRDNYKEKFKKSIYNVSWHGFSYNHNGNIRMPVIHLKNKKNKKELEIRHKGKIKNDKLFPFPICSLYIPKKFYDNSIKFQKLQKGIPEENIIHLKDNVFSRIDFFILPKNYNAIDFKDTTTFLGYLFSDNTLFSREYHGEFRKLKKCHPYKSLKIINHDILYRIVKNEETYLPELDNTYSLFIHNPNNSFEVIYNRLTIIGNDRSSLRDEHDKELEKIRNKQRNKNY
jgi:hypothetical protein